MASSSQVVTKSMKQTYLHTLAMSRIMVV